MIPEEHPLKDFKKVSLAQAAELPMLLLGEEFRIRQIWQEQLALLGRRPQVQAELNHMAGILDSLPHTRLATVLPGRARQLHANQGLLWKPLSEPRVPLRVGLVFRDAQRQQATLELLQSMLEGAVSGMHGAAP
ncbi:LysR substrate binding domain protein [compost metagenome]